MSKKKTFDEFIKLATKTHNNKYNYSKAEYKNNTTPICIICPKHGEFWQIPKIHLKGSGCPKCAIEQQHEKQKHTNNTFIKKAKEKHGEKYDYSKVKYENNRTKICIICPEHGEFWQTPSNHLKGSGCPKCGNKSTVSVTRTSLPKFIENAREIHGNNYDYSKVKYSNAHSKIIIICPEHGEFKMTPAHHLDGQGCPLCGNINKGFYLKSNTENFIKQAQKTHNNKYDYSKVNYINNHTPILISCPIHGDFQQRPIVHLSGHGCPSCGAKYNISEKLVLNELKEKYSNVEYQYRPKWLHGKTSSQSLDFFLPEYNIGIEYHGGQHFYPNTRFGGEDLFLLTQERDKRKYERCLENGVKVFYISFERKIPDDYFAPVYRTLDELFHAIDNEIRNQTNNIKLNENDLKYIINQTYKKIIK